MHLKVKGSMSLIYLHLITVLPAFLIGGYLLLTTKGTRPHRLLGKVYMVLMLVTALTSLGITSAVGPQFFGHFGFIHIFSALVLISVPRAYFAARNGNIGRHKANMQSLYLFGVILAGSLAFLPGRLLNQWLTLWLA